MTGAAVPGVNVPISVSADRLDLGMANALILEAEVAVRGVARAADRFVVGGAATVNRARTGAADLGVVARLVAGRLAEGTKDRANAGILEDRDSDRVILAMGNPAAVVLAGDPPRMRFLTAWTRTGMAASIAMKCPTG